MPRLIYIGPDPAEHGVVPLREGWPAENHDEPDEAVAAEKLAQRVKLPSTSEDGAPSWGGHVYRLEESQPAKPRRRAAGDHGEE